MRYDPAGTRGTPPAGMRIGESDGVDSFMRLGKV